MFVSCFFVTTSKQRVLNEGKVNETGTRLIISGQSKTNPKCKELTEEKMDESVKHFNIILDNTI